MRALLLKSLKTTKKVRSGHGGDAGRAVSVCAVPVNDDKCKKGKQYLF
jgi:hypothetical protein